MTHFDRIPNITALLKRHFFAGVLVLIPFGVIAWILGAVVGWLWALQAILPHSLQPATLFEDPTAASLIGLLFTLLLALLLALGISLLGWVSKQYLGQKTLDAFAHLIQRIPVIRSIYSSLDQLMKTFSTGGGQQFSRVVYVEFPRRECWAIAFVTSPARGPNPPPRHLNLFLPATPNMTSGFHIIVPETDVRESGMTVEEAFKTILSFGIAQPGATASAHAEGAPRGQT